MWRRKKEEKIIKKCVDEEKRDKGKKKLKLRKDIIIFSQYFYNKL